MEIKGARRPVDVCFAPTEMKWRQKDHEEISDKYRFMYAACSADDRVLQG